MTFNAAIDIPTLVFLLLLAMFYPIRKDHTIVYRTFCFFTIYWVQLITYLKIMHDVLIGIDFVQHNLRYYPDGNFAKANDILFGGLKSQRLFREQVIYFVFLYMCLIFT